MAHAVLSEAAHWIEHHVLAELDSEGAPEERVTRASEALFTFYDGGKRSCLLELFSTGDAREPFGEEIAGALRRLQVKLSSVAKEVGVPENEADRRAEDAVIAIQGSLVLARGLRDGAPFQRVLNELPRRLLTIG
jgi:hypothetical protein